MQSDLSRRGFLGAAGAAAAVGAVAEAGAAGTEATLWNNAKDDIAQDAAGIATAKNLGRRVAEVARLLAPK